MTLRSALRLREQGYSDLTEEVRKSYGHAIALAMLYEQRADRILATARARIARAEEDLHDADPIRGARLFLDDVDWTPSTFARNNVTSQARELANALDQLYAMTMPTGDVEEEEPTDGKL